MYEGPLPEANFKLFDLPSAICDKHAHRSPLGHSNRNIPTLYNVFERVLLGGHLADHLSDQHRWAEPLGLPHRLVGPAELQTLSRKTCRAKLATMLLQPAFVALLPDSVFWLSFLAAKFKRLRRALKLLQRALNGQQF